MNARNHGAFLVEIITYFIIFMMNQFIKRVVLLVVLLMATMGVICAQGSSMVETKVNELVKKYENVKGVECMSVGKGLGLNMIKMMFNKQFGKEFMKGVTSISIIDYSDAPQSTCMALLKELDAFVSLLQEYKIGKDKELSKNDYLRSFAKIIDSSTISDFVVAVENKESKVIMYMAGKIKVEK